MRRLLLDFEIIGQFILDCWKDLLGFRLFLYTVVAMFAICLVMPMLAQAGQGIAGTGSPAIGDVSLGGYSLPLILSLVLALIYKTFPKFPGRFKVLLSAVIGIGMGLAAMAYQGQGLDSFKVIADGVLAGFMTGMSAVGLHQLKNKTQLKE